MLIQDVEKYFVSLSNWGRWGAEDERGTLNLISAAQTVRATSLVTEGRVIGCARVISPSWAVDNPTPCLHHMVSSGEGAPMEGVHETLDWFGLAPHGLSFTHLDGLNHLIWNRTYYNGRDAAGISTARGGRPASVEAAADGIIGRGVLLDLPKFTGRDYLEIGEVVFQDQLEACAAAAGVSVSEGDILIVRTGRDARTAREGPWDAYHTGSAGLHVSCLPWLHEKGVAVLAADGANEVFPSGVEGLDVPLHAVALVAMGLWLADNLYLEELADHCARTGRYDFLFCLAPLRLKAGTGSPLTPVAVF
ncbi:MAG: hypothetical protein ABS81_06045 [Pseudonocardia sp. SCN 72-86]|nr:MAG: hypothetical protein ABS81_06045 [Pseudonocardia sp. SCN 72-86]